MDCYLKYSSYLKEKYGEKAYKIPVNLEFTCPNRDGTKGTGGCIYCSDMGVGYEYRNNKETIKEQIEKNTTYIGEKYNAHHFIVYFGNFTPTYVSDERFSEILSQCIAPNVKGICFSTRPDCMSERKFKLLKQFEQENNIDIYIEYGLQSACDETLIKINRGHTVKEFCDAVKLTKSYGFNVGAHIILNLPYDDFSHTEKSAKLLNSLNIDNVKVHSLHVVKNTVLCDLYQKGEFEICTMEEYIDRVITFLEHLSPTIYIQRLLSRLPKEYCEFENWGRSWRFVQNEIEKKMIDTNAYQGKLF